MAVSPAASLSSPITSAASPNASSSTSSNTTLASNFQTFLTLLTTQLAHQDPTKPQADGEFIAQLAQFSSLEQLTQMQATLKKIGAALGVPVEETGK